MNLIKCLLQCPSTECVSNMLYWFYSTAAQSCVALVAFVAVIYIFKEQKTDNKITFLINNIIERMNLFGGLHHAFYRDNPNNSRSHDRVISWKNDFDLSTIIKDKDKSINSIIQLGISISQDFNSTLVDLIKPDEINTLDDLMREKDKNGLNKDVNKAIEDTINELVPVINQVKVIYLLNISSMRLKCLFRLSTALGLTTFLASCFGIVFTNNKDAICLFGVIVGLLILLVIFLWIFLFFKLNENENMDNTKVLKRIQVIWQGLTKHFRH